MFQSARFKLTLWYLLIIMAISIFFSAVIYFGATREFDRILRVQRYRMEHPEIRFRIMQQGNFFETIPLPPLREPQLIQEAKMRVLQNLIGINTLILLFSSLAGYFLAGRTLKPIKEMVEEQNRFITDASHELNTPLTSLRTSIEVNLRDSQLTLEKAKEVLESNLEETKNLHILSDELIKLTQYQKPNGNFAFETIVLADVIAAAIQKINKSAKQKEITIIPAIPKITLQGEKKSLIELFVILLDNAIKYSKEQKEITISAKEKNEKIEITVADQGTGINEKDLPNIFERFYRADESRSKQQVSGYGLGLSIAKRIVNLHKGTISVTSKTEKGTTFTIVFPHALEMS